MFQAMSSHCSSLRASDRKHCIFHFLNNRMADIQWLFYSVFCSFAHRFWIHRFRNLTPPENPACLLPYNNQPEFPVTFPGFFHFPLHLYFHYHPPAFLSDLVLPSAFLLAVASHLVSLLVMASHPACLLPPVFLFRPAVWFHSDYLWTKCLFSFLLLRLSLLSVSTSLPLP